MSLRRRLTVGSSVTVATVLLLASVVVYVAVRDQVRGQIDDQLRTRSAVIVSALTSGNAGFPPAGPTGRLRARIPDPPSGQPFGYFQLVGPSGVIIRPSSLGDGLPGDDKARAVAAGRRGAYLSDIRSDDLPLRLLVTPAGDGRALELALPLEGVNDLLGWLRWALFLVGVGGVAVTAAISAAASRAALAPLAKLTSTAEEVTHTSDLARRIPHEGTDEVGRIAESFNEMLEALESSQTAQRNLVLDASHELRTPLTAIRTNIDVLSDADDQLDPSERREILTAVRDQLTELSTLVADVVELARGNEAQGERTRQRLDHLVERCIERAESLTPGATIVSTTEPCTVDAVGPQLERAISNLLDNAIKWSPPGGTVEVSVRAGEVIVRDHGPGISEQDLPHVFDRFYRAEAARALPGSGLGLAIVQQAATAHGGVATAERPSGGGALLRLTLPTVPDPERNAVGA